MADYVLGFTFKEDGTRAGKLVQHDSKVTYQNFCHKSKSKLTSECLNSPVTKSALYPRINYQHLTSNGLPPTLGQK